MSSMFIVTIAARAGQLLNNENFWFMVTDQINQRQTALYNFGNKEVPPPQPTTWSITRPPITRTPEPLGVADWGGTATLSETRKNRVVRTKIWISPDVLKGRIFGFEIHAHVNEPELGESRISFSAPFRLREVSRDVSHPGLTELMNAFRPKILDFAPPPGR